MKRRRRRFRRRAARFSPAARPASVWSDRAGQAWGMAARVVTDPWFITVVGGVAVAILLLFLGLQP